MKEKDLSCFGLVFTACSVLGRLLASEDCRDFPENLHVRVKINKRSFEPFCVQQQTEGPESSQHRTSCKN